jgi:hypothetical protein
LVESVTGASSAPSEEHAGCIAFTPTSDTPEVTLSFAAPGHFSVTPARTGVYTTQLEPAGGNSDVRSGARGWSVPAGERLVLSVTATKPWLRLTIPANGLTTLCNATPTG